MSFASQFQALPLADLRRLSLEASEPSARQSLARTSPTLADFARLISPAASSLIEPMAARSQALTQRRFGKVIRLFAPLYLSNECINICRYCGFSRDNPIFRVTLTPDEVQREAHALLHQGFRNLLLVAGEHPKFVSSHYLQDCVARLHPFVPSLSLEVGPLDTPDYGSLVEAGAEGLVVYQETYNRTAYAQLHPSGPKRDFDWRLETPERAYSGGFRRLGIGALVGLADWRSEAIAVAAHASHLLRHCWKAQLTVSIPRLRPSAGEFQPSAPMSDRELVQLVCAYRILLPDVGLVLSTREPAHLRDGLIPLGITLVSAGSHTEPGGYTGAGRQHLHLTERGKIVALPNEKPADHANTATRQFSIADERPAELVAETIRRLGYEPVWKDWDEALTPSSAAGNPVHS